MRVQGSRIKGFINPKGANCKLLIHSDTTDGSTTFADSSGQGHSITEDAADGSVQHDTAQKRFGKTSMLFDGVDGTISIADHADVALGSTPFTIDLWLMFNAFPSEANFGIFQQYEDTNNNWRLYLNDTGGNKSFNFVQQESGPNTIILAGSTVSIATGTWYHVAVIRGWGDNADDWVITLNGVPCATLTDSSAIADITAAFEIGESTDDSGFMDGWIDEFRLVKGTAMWTKGFVPPKGMYT